MSEYDANSHHERLSAVEVDVRHLDQRLKSLDANMSEGFNSLRQLISAQRQPITAFAGWAAVILALVGAFGAPLMRSDARLQERIDGLKMRELEDSYSRGKSEQRFATLHEELNAAINNRKDMDAKHEAAQVSLSARIDEVTHLVDNGLGRRIDEKIAPLIRDIEWIKEALARLEDD